VTRKAVGHASFNAEKLGLGLIFGLNVTALTAKEDKKVLLRLNTSPPHKSSIVIHPPLLLLVVVLHCFLLINPNIAARLLTLSLLHSCPF
jgi:hypothetical protein